MNSKVNVTVVIPNYNGMKWMEICLKSLERQKFKGFKVIIVDNGSTDGSVEMVEEKFPQMEVRRLDKNYGFSYAVNYGIKAADTEFVLLLNNDTEVDENFVGELYKSIRKSKKIFSCSSKMLGYYDRSVIDDAGDLYTIFGWATQRGVGSSANGYNTATDIFSSCAGAAIYRRDAFKKVGYFDLLHFAYLEDVDLGYRARIQGYKNVYCPKAIVYHIGSATSGGKVYSDFKVKLSSRNNVYLNYKNMPLLQLIINMPALLLGIAVKYYYFKRLGYEKPYVEGLKEAFATLDKCKKVKFEFGNLWNYIIIEVELIFNAIEYVTFYINKKLREKKIIK